MIFRACLIVAACWLASGCATKPTPPQSLLDSGSPVTLEHISHNVALIPDLAGRTEPLATPFGRAWPMMTGEIWRLGFPTAPAQRAVDATLDVQSTSLKQEIVALGFASRYTYTVSAVLRIGDRAILLTTEGYSTTVATPVRGCRNAVSMAVDDLARQALEALAAIQKPSAAQRLRELEALRADKLITEDEFQSRRKLLLQEL